MTHCPGMGKRRKEPEVHHFLTVAGRVFRPLAEADKFDELTVRCSAP